MRPDNLGYLFDAALTLAPESPALFQADVVLSYAELDARANRMANALRDLGIGSGDRVALMFSNDFRFLESLFGLPGMGSALLESVTHRDYVMLQTVVLLYAFLFMTVNLVIDLTYAWLDPRIRFD